MKSAFFFGFTQCRMVVSYRCFRTIFWSHLQGPSRPKRSVLLDVPEDVTLMFSLIAVLIFFSLPQLLVDTKIGLFHCLLCKRCILNNLHTKSSFNLIDEFSSMFFITFIFLQHVDLIPVVC